MTSLDFTTEIIKKILLEHYGNNSDFSKMKIESLVYLDMEKDNRENILLRKVIEETREQMIKDFEDLIDEINIGLTQDVYKVLSELKQKIAELKK